MQFCVIYLKIWDSTNRMLHYAHLYFVLDFLFLVAHTSHQIHFPPKGKYLLCLVSSLLVGWWMRLDVYVLQCEVEEPLLTSCTRSLTNVRLNSWCDNFEPQEARTIKLLRIVRSSRWKNIFFVHFQGFTAL